MVMDDQQPHLGALTSGAAWQRWRHAVVDRYRRQGPNCPIALLMSEIGRTTPGAQAVTAELMANWHGAIAAGIRAMQEQGKVAVRVDANRAAAALLAGISGRGRHHTRDWRLVLFGGRPRRRHQRAAWHLT